MKKRGFLWMLSIALLVGNQSFAAGGEGPMFRCMQKQMRGIFDKLNLTDDQKVKIQAIRNKARDNTKSNLEQLKGMRDQMHAMMQSDKIDETKLDAVIDSSTKLEAQVMKSNIMTHYQIYNILNDSQKSQFQAMKGQAENACMKAPQSN